ncbi:MAG: glycerophosphodiester phosphodiesterase [Opitutae bacterium]|nr:glycerophosphodiester phosphodiesterase [Opitutae bacterium]
MTMVWMVWPVAILAALLILYLWLIAPRRRHPAADLLTGRLYAHRELHDGNQTVPENSLAAFRRAVDAGYGIELDVQLTGDGQLVVHHDGNTLRVCGKDADIRRTVSAALPLLPDGTAIPPFAEVLRLVAGRVPLIVEIKHYGSPTENAAATLEALRGYPGPYCVESFHPLAVRYFRQRAPGVVRGQLAMGGLRNPSESSLVAYLALKYLLVNAIGRPHFVAYSCTADRNLSLFFMKRVFRPLLAAWTIRDEATLAQARKSYQMLIFERFTPGEARQR